MSIITEIHSLFVLLLALFTLAATFLALYSISNAIRLRNVRMSWNSGKLAGYPLFSTLFLSSAAVITGVSLMYELNQYYTIFACYSWMGVSWWISSYIASKTYITDHGIVKNINDPSQTIAWHQICDYVERPKSRGSDYLFMYQNLNGEDETDRSVTRLELFVPDRRVDKFEKIVSLKVGKYLSSVSDIPIDIETLE
ncbi:hypothetical protein [Rhodohalobacter sp. 8-1]|uniref:hypothetical protein n=1 Tax=Rhodohalobacter sp. 8-1 TaxID=3131972 RepID=UPI0030EEE7D0